MKVLVLNSGSSSIKYQLLGMENENCIAKGIVDKIGFDQSNICYENQSGYKNKYTAEVKDHLTGIKVILDILMDKANGVIKSIEDITGVGHRMAHGARYFTDSVLVTEDVKEKILKTCEIAPLHNPPQYKGIQAIEQVMPGIPNVVCFDTEFHKGIPDHVATYGLPYEWLEKYNIRKYGFHGLSYKYVTRRVGEIFNIDWKQLKIITCHLGNGASVAAVKNGETVDTTMGFTPLQGLIMGTRCGDIDPAIVPFIMKKEGYSVDEITDILNKKSGVLGVSGLSSDFRDLEEAANKGDEKARLALEMFIYRVKFYIGAYNAVLNGIDVLIFTGGIGENSTMMRQAICKNLEDLGIVIDLEKNDFKGKERIISPLNNKVKVVVIPTNEELMIARDVKRIIS